MYRRRHRLVAALFALTLAAAVSACGDDATETTDEPDITEPQPEDPTETDEPDDAAQDGETVRTDDTDLGTILVDGEGRTLYLFTQDSPGMSACEDECLEAWPALEGEASAGEGVDAELLGTIERGDGTTQATYNDWPLYYFVQDSEPGDIAGQGVNDVWWVLDAEGNAIEDMPEQDNDGGGTGGGRDY
jgi:predicted lipoprotein with Yx(FWY)xxD motif